MVQMTRRRNRSRLPKDFAPEKHTVLCGRGKEYTSSTGNKHLKSLVYKYLVQYSEAQSKIEKSSIVSEIMEQIKGLCFDAAFVKLEKEVWWEVDDAFAREKIGRSEKYDNFVSAAICTYLHNPPPFAGCMFRDTLHTQYRSSTKAKFARKKANLASNRRGSSSSIQSMVSTQSSSSVDTDASNYASKNFGHPAPQAVLRAEPTMINPVTDYYSLLSSYLTFGANQQQQQQQLQQQQELRNIQIPMDFCVMPTKMPSAPQPVQFDDFPDDLSGIFDDF
ncbi:MAG: hypothetical protein SGBAC_001168 [Bacillariaceae sp.]